MISLRVMLVDDEEMVIDDLRSIIKWERYGCSIVATTTNGSEVLSLYKKYRPQILFIDICMPVMSGLDIVRTITEYGDNVVIILLSAYRDFRYAQRAISYGVSRYLLKHELDARSLIAELLAARKKWESNQRKRTLVLQEAFRDLLLHRNEPSEHACQQLGLGKGSCGGWTVLFIVQKETPFKIFDKDETSELSIPELTLPDDLFDGHPIDVVCFLESDPLVKVFLLRFVTEVGSTWNHIIVGRMVRRLGSDVLERLSDLNLPNCSVLFSVTGTNAKAIQDAYAAYEKVKSYTFFSANETDCIPVFKIEDLLGIVENECSQSESGLSSGIKLVGVSCSPAVQHIVDSLERFQYDEMKKGIESLFEGFRRAPWNLDQFKKTITLLYDSLCQYRSRHGLLPISCDNREDTDWYRFQDAKRWFVDAFLQTAEATENLQLTQHNLEVYKAVEYIHRHYQENISLEDVSAAVGVSKSHLSRLFRKHLNTTVLEYLTAHRINISKRLIKSGGYRMYEISSLAGFNSNQYFSYVFHKVTGMAPHTFAENCLRRIDRRERNGLKV